VASSANPARPAAEAPVLDSFGLSLPCPARQVFPGHSDPWWEPQKRRARTALTYKPDMSPSSARTILSSWPVQHRRFPDPAAAGFPPATKQLPL